ncbi:hypothetical protein AXF42_Ash021338 [Apostasia shenzhenica]|uniref:Uncharacterized protein n=1 Tax=Apostasia shenzhenica TaxID=1088818 RepID=A0A2I0ADZ5_9ASPA|nr:hypothetical protein AXF42_Ash021338 [Apostasia shenzhenica]
MVQEGSQQAAVDVPVATMEQFCSQQVAGSAQVAAMEQDFSQEAAVASVTLEPYNSAMVPDCSQQAAGNALVAAMEQDVSQQTAFSSSIPTVLSAPSTPLNHYFPTGRNNSSNVCPPPVCANAPMNQSASFINPAWQKKDYVDISQLDLSSSPYLHHEQLLSAWMTNLLML